MSGDYQTIWRTEQRGRRLREKHTGPVFTSKKEAKRALEHFIANGHGAEVTEWEDDGDGAEKMAPSGSSSVFYVYPSPLRESFDELLDDENAPEATA